MLEYPKTASVGQIRIVPSENFGLVFTGQAQNLTDGKASNPTNVGKRLSVPARYDVPYKGKVAFSIEGMVSGRQTRLVVKFPKSRVLTPDVAIGQPGQIARFEFSKETKKGKHHHVRRADVVSWRSHLRLLRRFC